jgi:hypothetical protein
VLNPLTVGNIGLPAGHVLDVMGVDQPHVNLSLLQNLKQRNPVHTGRFHRYSSDLALLKPVRQPLQIDGERWEAPNRLSITVSGNRDENLCRAYIDARGVGLYHG